MPPVVLTTSRCPTLYDSSVRQPPDRALETSEGFLWIDDGILIGTSKGEASTEGTVSELFAALEELVGEERFPMLFDARGWPGGSLGAWQAAIPHFGKVCTAVAMLVDAEPPQATAIHMGQAIDRLLIPFRIFSDEAEAMAFLHRMSAAGPNEPDG